jgi:zinc-ribbon domain
VIRSPRKLCIPVSFLVLWILCPISARAAATRTFLTLETAPVIAVGVHPAVMVHLTTSAGPVGGALLEIRFDGRQTKSVLTDRDGRASTVLAKDLDAGDYKVQAVFNGTSSLLASQSAVAAIHVTAAVFTVQTVPPLPNIPLLKVDGQAPLSTGADGTIRILISKVGRYELEIAPPPADADRRVTFSRWGDGSRESLRTIRLPGTTTLGVGLEVSYRVGFSFLDSTGATVDPTRIESLRIANSRGDLVQPLPSGSEWFIANQIARGADGLTSVPIEYRIQEVGMRGTSVVDRGRLHFQPDGETRTWVVPLLLYSLTLTGRDALFGTALGSSVQLTYPDGASERVTLDEHASATISALPRGNYRASIEKPPGIPLSTPIVLSRDQDVRVLVISYADLAAAAGLGLFLMFALLWVGRRGQLPWLVSATEAPFVLARRMSFASASGLRRGLPLAGSAVARVRRAFATIGERGAAAFGFASILLWRVTVAIAAPVELAVARVQGTLATIGERGAAPFGFARLQLRRLAPAIVALVTLAVERMVLSVELMVRAGGGFGGLAARMRPRDDGRATAATSETGPGPSRPRRATVGDRVVATQPIPSPSVPPKPETTKIIRAAAKVRAAGKPESGVATEASRRPVPTVSSWFAPDPDDTGPTHECSQCHRQVPDSARFCPICGRSQA